MKPQKFVKSLSKKAFAKTVLILSATLIAGVSAGAAGVRATWNVNEILGGTAFVSAPTRQDEIHIELGAGGFTPAQVLHAAGTFAIAVENSTLTGTYTLRLKTAEGTVLKEVEVQQGSAAWTVTLQAGEYTLTEASHPQWLCRITVQ